MRQLTYEFVTPWMLIWIMDANLFEEPRDFTFDLHLANDYKIQRFFPNQALCSFNNVSHVFVIANVDTTIILLGEVDGEIQYVPPTRIGQFTLFIYDMMGETWNRNNGTYVRTFLNAERDNHECVMVMRAYMLWVVNVKIPALNDS